MKLRKTVLAAVMASLLLISSAPVALAWGKFTDIFDWGRADAATKEEIVSDLQELLIREKILSKRYTASSLVKVVEKRLAIDNNQAIILDKLCEGLKLNCDKLLEM
ncbi:MAG: hypothetical protein LBV79_02660 [Candidatus Adiutrix sp.]|nr:hypothetical protein [Candidatus Adiutrix sp.]